MIRLFVFVAVISSSAAYAFPMTSANRSAANHESFLADSYDFEGIVQLSNCSGALVRYEDSSATDKALVMTNGHCVPVNGGLMSPGQFIHNQSTQRQFSLLSRDGQSRIGTVTATKIQYATMTGTDVAIYELNETFAQISDKYNVDALTVSSAHPQAGLPIEIISGDWRRGYGCSVDGFVFELREAGYVFTDSIRYEVNGGCKTIHGTSGSPIIEGGTRTVVGVNNTGSDDGEKCTMNNPCEVDENGEIFAQKGRSYGQQTNQIYSCLNVGNQIDLMMDGCKLFKK